ncbi:hypothetical protein [Paractinoplanes maris]|uniref:hypothetical protein n=1 Tax=Paractinoplanes maris TaxID=1734446 RepID=UPI0020215B04|nr:hypothetical protein [Actinoplanes maris]
MTTTTTLTGCPAWCASVHLDSETVHYQDDVQIPATNGRPLPVSAFITADRSGVYVAGYELTAHQADQLALLLADRVALLAETVEDANGATR